LNHRNLASVRIQRDSTVASHDVEEVYRCDAAGVVEVTIADQTTGCARTFQVRGAGEATESRTGRTGRNARGR
jgi:hypothetical protein